MSNGLKFDKVPKVWGRELIFLTEPYCVKFLQYDGPRTSSKHYHERKHETFIIIKGRFEIEFYSLDDESAPPVNGTYGPGAVVVLEPRTVHRLKCLSPDGGVVAECSSHEDPDDCVRLEPSVNPFGQA